MADYHTFSVVIAAASVVVYVINSIVTTRKAEKMRQAQLFMELYNTYRRRDFRMQYSELLWNQMWTDYDDWYQKFGPETNPDAFANYTAVLAYFEGVGQLVKRKMIDRSLVYDLLSIIAIWIWEKMEPTVKGQRERMKTPRIWEDYEYLYNEMKKYEHQRPELKT